MESVFRTPEGKQEILQRYEQILTLWPEPYEQKTVPTAYGDTFVIASGVEDGDVVVLLHGSTTNAAMWLADAAVLGQTHRVYAVDILGEPGKSAESRPAMTGTTYAEWLVQVMDGLGIKKAAFGGNSLGGWMALCLATYAPERVSALMLLAPAGLAPVRTSFLMRAAWLAIHGQKGADRLTRLLFADVKIPPEATAFAALLQRHYIPRPLQKMLPFSNDQLRHLNMPVLFFGGEIDPLIHIPHSAERLAQLVPQADIRILPGKAHTLINLGHEMAAFLAAHKDDMT